MAFFALEERESSKGDCEMAMLTAEVRRLVVIQAREKWQAEAANAVRPSDFLLNAAAQGAPKRATVEERVAKLESSRASWQGLSHIFEIYKKGAG